MFLIYLFIISIILAVTDSAAPLKFSQDQFVRNENHSQHQTLTKEKSHRPTRSYGDLDVTIEFWPESFPFIHSDQTNFIGFDFDKNGHVTPDFSNGLNYPDPLLLTGLISQRAVSYLYGKELFFGNIPHVRAVLRNQEERRANGLPENRLTTSRIEPLFQRFKSI